MILNDRVYQIMKWVNILAVPLVTFLVGIVNAVMTGSIEAIITAIIGGAGTVAGVIIKASDTNYYKLGEGAVIEEIPVKEKEDKE
jgi:spore maturation protein SpmA